MTWFARSQTDDTQELLLQALDDVLVHLETEAAPEPPPRLIRLRERLARPPVPTGLRRELAAVLAQLQVDATQDGLSDVPTLVSEMTTALVDALDAASLLDVDLATQIDELGSRVPTRVGGGDARQLKRDAERLREIALPARERAERSRREVHRLVSELSTTLEPALRNAASLDWGLGELSGRLASAHEPETLAHIRAELTHITRDLAGTSSAMRRRLTSAMAQVRELQEALDDTRQQLADVRAESERDALTGVLNRGGFDRRLVEALQARGGQRHQDAERGLCLVLLDIDHFKQVNDTWGHPTGDEVLRRVADHLQREVRSMDVVGRVGGEEFGLVLQDLSMQAALDVVERIRTAVEADVHDLEEGRLQITLSAGVAAHEGDETALGLYKRADGALYEAKAGGRNRFVLAA